MAVAASQYEFTISSEGAYVSERRGRILVDGTRWRVDIEKTTADVTAHDCVIGNTAGERIAINHGNQTWYHLPTRTPVAFTYSLFDFLRTNPSSALKAKIDQQDDRLSAEHGKTTIGFRYGTQTAFGSESVRGEISGRIVVWTRESAEALQPLLLVLAFSSGIDAIDQKLKARIAEIAGTMEKSELTVTRRFVGGEAMTQVIRTTITEGSSVAAQDEDFKLPKDYREQKPVIGGPMPGTS